MYCSSECRRVWTVDLVAQVYWLAGLLEGEGTFQKGPPSDRTCAILRLAMTDEDVVAHAARLFDRAVVRWDRRSKPLNKRVFITTTKGAAALALMERLLPVMGRRRQQQIETVLAAPRPTRSRTLLRGEICSVSVCERPVRSRGLCRQHYNSWWKATRYGRRSKYMPVVMLPPAASVASPLSAPDPESRYAVHWVAGLLEGEGTFGSSRGYPDISATMCDRDVLERAARILGIATVSAKDFRRTAERGWSPEFDVGLSGSRAAEWMRALRPLMGARRTAEIDAALAAYHPIRLTRAPAVCAMRSCGAPHRSRGLCHKHYMSWTRDVKLGRAPRVKPLR